ncbi:hypothetical protein [Chelatococcus sp.]|uniref:hypothetical protein n=1 Tax=Chelatococcus sp. TaxID=1953771 RepID=UPI001ECAAC15|nr:hypothetical protein [Chelatococcus sp.]MBX3543568.1 hypothetical protein [Chelatococcus sp.]
MGGLALSAGLGLSRRTRRAGPRYDPDAVALFGYFAAPPADAYRRLLSDFNVALKDHGAWPDIDLIYDLGAMDATVWARNLRNPGANVLTPVNSPTVVPRVGGAGNGTTSYFDTGFSPANAGGRFAINDASMWVQSPSSGQSASPICGAGTGYVTSITPRNASDQTVVAINTVTSGYIVTIPGTTDGAGLWGVQQLDAATKRVTRNGVGLGADIALPAEGRPTGNIRLGGRSPSSFSAQTVRFFMAGASLAGKGAAIAAAFAALKSGMDAL